MKKGKHSTFEFHVSNGKDRIRAELEKKTFSATVEIFLNEELLSFEKVDFDVGYWLKFFEVDGTPCLICIKEIEELGEDCEVKCYQNGCSLTDGDTVEELKRRIEDPHYGEVYSAAKQRKNLFWSVVVSLLVAVAIVLIWGRHVSPWEQAIQFFGTLILYWGKHLIDHVTDRRIRKSILRVFSENDKNN